MPFINGLDMMMINMVNAANNLKQLQNFQLNMREQSDDERKWRDQKQARFDEKIANHDSLNVLRYQTCETLKICEQNKQYYIETDRQFISDVQNIAKIQKNDIFQLLDKNKKEEVTDQHCDEIDFKARLHYKANVINSNSKLQFKDIPQQNRCQCGCNRGSGELFGLCIDEQQLNVLGPGIILMFLYKRAVIAVLAMILVIYGIFALVTNLIGDQAILNEECAKDPYCQYKHNSSIENKNYDEMDIIYAQLWLGFIFSIVWAITLRFIKFVGREKNKNVDEKLRSASDYTIKIENLPYGSYSELELIEYFDGLYEKMPNKYKKYQDQDEKNPFKMENIQVIYNMEFSRQMVNQILYLAYVVDSLLIKPEGQSMKNYVKNIKAYQENKTKLKQTYELLIDLRKKFLNDPSFRQSISTTCCLIKFETQTMRQIMLENYGIAKVSLLKKIQSQIKNFFRGSTRDIIFKGNVIQIERAPQPSDLLWTNCEKVYSLKRKIIIYSTTFIIVVVSFGIQLALQYLQNLIKTRPSEFLSDTEDQGETLTTINIAMSVAILLVNRFLWFSLYYLLQLEYNHTLTQKIVSQMNKVLFAASFNTIVVPILTSQIFVILGQSRSESLYATDGLSGMVFDYQVSVLIGLVIKLFDPLYFGKKIVIEIKCLRNLFIRFICSKTSEINLQKGVAEINKFYEGSYMDVAQTYMYIIGAVLHAAFFCHLQPFVMVLVFAMILLFYLINRFKLLRFCLIPQMTQLLVFETALAHAGLVPIIYGVGSIVISYLEENVNPQRKLDWTLIPSSLSIFIGVLAFFNPGDFMNKIVQTIMEKCQCISIEKIIGNEEELDVRDELGEENKEQTKRIEDYFENSNTLNLLGFQKIIKGEEKKQIMKELKLFCEQFFPKKRNKPIQFLQQFFNKQKSMKQSDDEPQEQNSSHKLNFPLPFINPK